MSAAPLCRPSVNRWVSVDERKPIVGDRRPQVNPVPFFPGTKKVNKERPPFKGVHPSRTLTPAPPFALPPPFSSARPFAFPLSTPWSTTASQSRPTRSESSLIASLMIIDTFSVLSESASLPPLFHLVPRAALRLHAHQHRAFRPRRVTIPPR